MIIDDRDSNHSAPPSSGNVTFTTRPRLFPIFDHKLSTAIDNQLTNVAKSKVEVAVLEAA